MNVFVINKNDIGVITIKNVTNISYSNGVYSITNGSGTQTFNSTNYFIQISILKEE